MTSARKLIARGAFGPLPFAISQLFAASEPGFHAETYNPDLLLARRNRLTYTEQLDNAAWTKADTTITANADGTADKIVEAATTAVHTASQASASPGVQNVVTARIKPDGRTWVYITLGTATAFFNLAGASGATGTVGGGLTASIIAAPGAAGYYDLTLSGIPASTALLFGLSTDGVVTSYLGVITNGVIVARTQIEWNTALPSAYQLVTDWSTEYIAAVGTASIGMWQDSAGTIAVTGVEQPVGLWRDWKNGKGAAGNHATQATAGSRPVLSARYNLLLATETLATQTYTATISYSHRLSFMGTGSVALSGATTGNLAGTGAAVRVSADFTLAIVLATPVISSVTTSTAGGTLAAATTYSYRVAAKDGGGRTLASTAVTVLTGAGATNSNTVNWSAVADSTGYDVFGRIGGSELLIASVAAGVLTYLDTGAVAPAGALPAANTTGITTFTPTGSVTQADLRLANDLGLNQSVYQRINTATDYTSTGFIHYLRFDGSDDGLVTPAINFSALNKMTIWAGFTHLTTAGAGIVCELTANGSTTNGGFFMAAPPAAASATVGTVTRGTVAASNVTHVSTPPASAVVVMMTDHAEATLALQLQVRRNGAAPALTTVGGPTTAGNYANAALNIGRRNNTNVPLNGRMTSLTVRGVTLATPALLVRQMEQYHAALAGQSFAST